MEDYKVVSAQNHLPSDISLTFTHLRTFVENGRKINIYKTTVHSFNDF